MTFKIALAIGLLSAVTFLAVPNRLNSNQSRGCEALAGKQAVRTVNKVRVWLRINSAKYSIRDSMVLDAALRNEGEEPVFIYGKMAWGYGGGLVIRLRNQEGKEMAPAVRDDTMLPPPPSDNDQTIFVRIEPDNFFGTRRVLPVKDLVTEPGKYSLQVEYRSPASCQFFDPKLQQMPALWHEDPSIFSTQVPLEVVQ
jgi:hypothetical protein